jgi:hypothetical protein
MTVVEHHRHGAMNGYAKGARQLARPAVQVAILGGLAFLASCGTPVDPPIAIGPCTLQVERKGDDGRLHVLVPPYVVPYSDEEGSGLLVFRGSGWTNAHVTQADPVGTVRRNEYVPGGEMATGQRGWFLDVEGTWRFRLEDDNGCVREFSIEARPADT